MSSRRVNSVIVFGDFSSRSIRLYRESIFSNNSKRLFLADIKWHSMLQIFIPAGSEPSGRARASIWRTPRGSNTPMLVSGYLTYIAAPATTGAALTFRKGEDAD